VTWGAQVTDATERATLLVQLEDVRAVLGLLCVAEDLASHVLTLIALLGHSLLDLFELQRSTTKRPAGCVECTTLGLDVLPGKCHFGFPSLLEERTQWSRTYADQVATLVPIELGTGD
jgi:hypothetical protein